MAIKETYKPKETNVKKLEIFLNKLEKNIILIFIQLLNQKSMNQLRIFFP